MSFQLDSHARAADLEKGKDPKSVPPLASPDLSPSSTRAPSPAGEMEHKVVDCAEKAFLVSLGPNEDPKSFTLLRKWAIVLVVSTSALCSTSASSMAAYANAGIAKEFHVSEEVAILGVTVFLLGLGMYDFLVCFDSTHNASGLGPLFVGPLSEVYGRNIVYRLSYSLFFAFSFAVAFAPNIGM